MNSQKKEETTEMSHEPIQEETSQYKIESTQEVENTGVEDCGFILPNEEQEERRRLEE